MASTTLVLIMVSLRSFLTLSTDPIAQGQRTDRRQSHVHALLPVTDGYLPHAPPVAIGHALALAPPQTGQLGPLPLCHSGICLPPLAFPQASRGMGACGLDFRGNARAGVEVTVVMGLGQSSQSFQSLHSLPRNDLELFEAQV